MQASSSHPFFMLGSCSGVLSIQIGGQVVEVHAARGFLAAFQAYQRQVDLAGQHLQVVAQHALPMSVRHRGGE